MTEDESVNLAIAALQNVRCRMQFADCWEEGVRNVATAIKAAVDDVEASALSFKSPSIDGYISTL